MTKHKLSALMLISPFLFSCGSVTRKASSSVSDLGKNASAPAPSSNASTAADATSYRTIEREKMLALLKEGSSYFTLQAEDIAAATNEQKAFFDYFHTQIYPALKTMRSLNFSATWHSLCLDRALYNDETERTAWETAKVRAEQDLNTLKNGDEWKQKISQWASLTGKLTGALADEARAEKKRLDIGAFSSDQIPKLNERSQLLSEIDAAANRSTFGDNLSKVAETIEAARREYEAKTLTLAEAASMISKARANGEQGQSRDIAVKVKDALNRSAVLATELARSKGYKSWSAYQVALQAEPYDDRFNSVERRIAFLENILTKTDAALSLLLKKLAAKDTSVNRDDLTESHLALLLPDAESFGKYFPRDEVDALWAQTLKESGFAEASLDQINRDVMPRENKYTHAYQTSLTSKTPKTLMVNAASLDFHLPDAQNRSLWNPAQLFILQNFFSDSIDALRVAFHEGGHAIHAAHEINLFESPEAYGYVEIHSMTQEYFAFDREFLIQHAKTKNGTRPQAQEIENYLQSAEIQEFMQFRILVARALYELQLWNGEFDRPQETFVDRSVRLYGEIIPRATGVKGAENHGVDFTGRGPFNAPHFRSGWVEYIGYVLAHIAAYQSHQSLLDFVEDLSGRRSLYRQPKLAERLISGYYESGYKKAFPQSVEAFTGKPYSVDEMASSYLRAIESL